MIESAEWLRTFISFHSSFEYIIIFLGVAFGGELVLFALAFLAAQGVVPFLPFAALSFLGTFFSNTLWFLLGKTAAITRIISHRYANTTVSMINEAICRVSRGNRLPALLLVKFLFGTPVILVMYTSKTFLRFRQFAYYESIIILFWLLFYIPIGYLAGLGFNYFSEIFHNLYVATGFILLVVIIIIMFRIWLEKIFTQKI